MIITLITIVVFVLGIVGEILYKRDIIPKKYKESIEFISLVMACFGCVLILSEISGIIYSQLTADKSIYEYNLERESIVKQVECISSDYEDVSKATVIANVYDWNKEVHSTKYWAKNPWTSWFWSQKFVDSLEYIELED